MFAQKVDAEADRNRWKARAEEMEAVAGELAKALRTCPDLSPGSDYARSAWADWWGEIATPALARYGAVKREEAE